MTGQFLPFVWSDVFCYKTVFRLNFWECHLRQLTLQLLSTRQVLLIPSRNLQQMHALHSF